MNAVINTTTGVVIVTMTADETAEMLEELEASTFLTEVERDGATARFIAALREAEARL